VCHRLVLAVNVASTRLGAFVPFQMPHHGDEVDLLERRRTTDEFIVEKRPDPEEGVLLLRIIRLLAEHDCAPFSIFSKMPFKAKRNDTGGSIVSACRPSGKSSVSVVPGSTFLSPSKVYPPSLSRMSNFTKSEPPPSV